MLNIFILIFLRPFASMKIQQRPMMETFQRQLPSSTVLWEGKRREGPQKALGVKTRAHHLQDRPGGTTGYQYPAHVTCHVSLSWDHCLSAKPTHGGLRMTFSWLNHFLLRSPQWDSDVPIKIFLLITPSAMYVMWLMVSLFNPSCIKIFNWKICFLHLKPL